MLIKKGKVVSTAMDKTATVRVESRRAHPKYKKIFTVSKKFLIDDPKNELTVGDVVEIVECKALSKNKFFRLQSIIKKV